MEPLLVLLFISSAFAQAPPTDVIIDDVAPCWENQTAGIWMLKQCGFDEDYLRTTFMGWEWVTGGYISMIIVALLIIIVWVKYHKVSYPILIGMLFLPIAANWFPAVFLQWALVMAFGAIGIIIWYIFIRQTKEY